MPAHVVQKPDHVCAFVMFIRMFKFKNIIHLYKFLHVKLSIVQYVCF